MSTTKFPAEVDKDHDDKLTELFQIAVSVDICSSDTDTAQRMSILCVMILPSGTNENEENFIMIVGSGHEDDVKYPKRANASELITLIRTKLAAVLAIATSRRSCRPSMNAGKQLGVRVRWLDLRGAGFSILERLCLEEILLHHDDSNWIISGAHEPRNHRFLQRNDQDRANAAIVMGISGKPEQLLNIERVKEDNVMTIKRFSGGGTVILDLDSIWVSIIGRSGVVTEEFPRPIMEWTANALYHPMFQLLQDRNSTSTATQQATMVLDTKSCAVENTGRMISLERHEELNEPLSFRLHENDYVLGHRKIGGNAQAIVKAGWIHHTSFLWDYSLENMAYLQLPTKRPEYRGDRAHDDFLMRIGENYPNLRKRDFFQSLRDTVRKEFEAEDSTVRDAMMIAEKVGGLQTFFDTKSRNKVVETL